MKRALIYSSMTGNTKQVAEKIIEVMPKDMEMFSVEEAGDLDQYNSLILGFWVDKGTADKKMLEIIDKVEDKEISIFATLGAYPDSDHAKEVVNKVTTMLESNNNKANKVFVCQGKISDKLKKRMLNLPKDHPRYPDEDKLKRWADADKHPNEEDFKRVQEVFLDLYRS